MLDYLPLILYCEQCLHSLPDEHALFFYCPTAVLVLLMLIHLSADFFRAQIRASLISPNNHRLRPVDKININRIIQ